MDVASTPTDACPQIGRAYQFAGAKAQAVAAFQRCLNLDSSNTDFIVYLASALERDGQFEAAEALFRKGAALSPTYADMQIGIASTRLYEGHIVEALYELQQLVKEHPGNGDAWLVLGVAYFKNNQFGQAESALHYGQTLSPKNAEFAVALGDLAEAQKHPDEAHLQYARALQLDPHNEEAAAHLQPAYLRWVPAGLWSRLRRARG
jgi:cytochrome c-type biogenesis protein CcmH/NrfG